MRIDAKTILELLDRCCDTFRFPMLDNAYIHPAAARVLETGDLKEYRPSLPPNTHWSHWPGGGTG